jgi:two-component system sensor histidine kinase QseC
MAEPRGRGEHLPGHEHGHTHEHPHEHPHEHAHEQGQEHPHEHPPRRGLKDILELIDRAELPPRVKQRAKAVFNRLGQAEAKVHGIDVQEVHFHEVGALDTIVDIVGSCICLELLGIDEIHCSPIPVGSGLIECEHGTMPAPAPATAGRMARIRILAPLRSSGITQKATSTVAPGSHGSVAPPNQIPPAAPSTSSTVTSRCVPSRPHRRVSRRRTPRRTNTGSADNVSGFSERVIAGETWRVYTVADPTRAIRVSVGDNLRVRHRLINDLMLGLLAPAIAGVVALAALIWAAVGIGLAPLREVARLLARRDPSDFNPLGIEQTTDELRPLVAAIDDQFAKLEKLRADERHFIASAAHELQTPLAGLRAHADIASMANDAATREKSLQSIRSSVDRTARMVGQLLDLSREESSGPPPAQWTSVAWVMESIADELSGDMRRTNVTLVSDHTVDSVELYIAPASLMLAVRNLVKNAVDHSPPSGSIQVTMAPCDDRIALCIRDQGSGVDQGSIGYIKDRFVRGARAPAPGSGLGLSIVELVARQADAELLLRNLEGRGFEAALLFNQSSVKET